jgi:hypothetical protein
LCVLDLIARCWMLALTGGDLVGKGGLWGLRELIVAMALCVCVCVCVCVRVFLQVPQV